MGVSFREAVPGMNLSRRVLAATFATAAAVVLAVALATSHTPPTVRPPGVWLRYAWECWGMSMISGLPVFAIAAWLVARTHPTRPALAGALCGLGVGVVAGSPLPPLFRGFPPAPRFPSPGG